MSIYRRPFRLLSILVVPIVLLVPTEVFADHEILFKKLHGNKAWLHVNGKPGAYAKGQPRNGVKVLSIKKKEIIVKVHGKRYLYKKNSKIGKKLQDEIKIPYNSRYSAYYVVGYINGKKIGFVLDTGATDVVISAKDAKRLKIPLKYSERTKVRLADGKIVDAWRTKVRSVRIGDIEITNVSVGIIKQKGEATPLLGMSFLSQLEISQSSNIMTLKYNPP